jgi:hypothetical protein
MLEMDQTIIVINVDFQDKHTATENRNGIDHLLTVTTNEK